MVEGPAAGAPTGSRPLGATALEDLAEQLFALVAAQENILTWCVLITVTRRDGDSFDPQRDRLIEELSHVIRVLAAEQRAVDGDPKSLIAREPNRRDGLVEHAFLAHGLVVTLPIPIQVNRKRQIRRRLIFVDMF